MASPASRAPAAKARSEAPITFDLMRPPYFSERKSWANLMTEHAGFTPLHFVRLPDGSEWAASSSAAVSRKERSEGRQGRVPVPGAGGATRPPVRTRHD